MKPLIAENIVEAIDDLVNKNTEEGVSNYVSLGLGILIGFFIPGGILTTITRRLRRARRKKSFDTI